MSPLDSFSQHFDAIEIDRAHAPSPQAIDSALEACAAYDRPGFHLLDDAGGRFVVDRDFGVVSLADPALLASERGRVHAVRLRVVEPSGERYELEMKLRVTGMTPQMVGAEDYAFDVEPAPPAAPGAAWCAFAAVLGLQATQRLPAHGAYGALVAAPLPETEAQVSISLSNPPPAPAPAHAPWSL